METRFVAGSAWPTFLVGSEDSGAAGMRINRCTCLILIGVAFLYSAWCTAAEPVSQPPARRSPISTHVLNTSSGRPAAQVAVALQRQAGKAWKSVGAERTDAQGRAANLYPPEEPLQAGTYRLVYETRKYFKDQGVQTFFPTVEVVFEIEKTGEHYHVPVLVSPFGYSTYRGS